MFEANKVAGIANAIVNTAAGVTKALEAYPPPFNFGMAAMVAAAGLTTLGGFMLSNKITPLHFAYLERQLAESMFRKTADLVFSPATEMSDPELVCAAMLRAAYALAIDKLGAAEADKVLSSADMRLRLMLSLPAPRFSSLDGSLPAFGR